MLADFERYGASRFWPLNGKSSYVRLMWWVDKDFDSATSKYSLKPTPHTSCSKMTGKGLPGNWAFIQAPYNHPFLHSCEKPVQTLVKVMGGKQCSHFCYSYVHAHTHKHAWTYTTSTPVLRHSAVSSWESGWCCGEAIWGATAWKTWWFDRRPEEHTLTWTHTHTQP